MSIATVVTRGYGTFSTVNLVVVRGYGAGGTVPVVDYGLRDRLWRRKAKRQMQDQRDFNDLLALLKNEDLI